MNAKILLLLVSAKIQATIQNPICDASKKIYKDMACCGEGQAVCVAPEVDVSSLQAKEQLVDTMVSSTMSIGNINAAMHDGKIYGVSKPGKCELNLPLLAEFLNGNEASFTSTFVELLSSYQMPYFANGVQQSTIQLAQNGKIYTRFFEKEQVKTPIITQTNMFVYKARIVSGMKWQDGSTLLVEDLLTIPRIGDKYRPGLQSIGSWKTPVNYVPSYLFAYEIDSSTIGFASSKALSAGEYDKMLYVLSKQAVPFKYFKEAFEKGLPALEALDLRDIPYPLPYKVDTRKNPFVNGSLIEGPIVTLSPVSTYATTYNEEMYVSESGYSVKTMYPFGNPRDDTPLAGGEKITRGAFFKKVNYMPCLTSEKYKDHSSFCWNMLKNGQIHALETGLTPYEPSDMNYTEFSVTSDLDLSSRYVAINTEMGPFKNKALRQAIMMAVDRQSLKTDIDMIDIVPQYNEWAVYKEGPYKDLYTEPVQGSPMSAGYGKTVSERGELIKTHLLQEGFTFNSSSGFSLDGEALPTILVSAPETDAPRMAAAVHIVKALKASGMRAEAKFMPFFAAGCSSAWYLIYPASCGPHTETAPEGTTFGVYIMAWNLGDKPNAKFMDWNSGGSYVATNTENQPEIIAKGKALQARIDSGEAMNQTDIDLAHEFQNLMYDDAYYAGLYGIQSRLVVSNKRPVYSTRQSKTSIEIFDFKPTNEC